MPRAATASASSEPAAPEPAKLEAALLAGTRVLLVDDNAEVRETTRALLESAGLQVVESAGAAEGLAAAGLGSIDVIVTDVVMPETSGPEMVAEIERRHGALPVVFLSGYAESAVGIPSGAALLLKPFSADQLFAKVSQVLRSRRDAGS